MFFYISDYQRTKVSMCYSVFDSIFLAIFLRVLLLLLEKIASLRWGYLRNERTPNTKTVSTLLNRCLFQNTFHKPLCYNKHIAM